MTIGESTRVLGITSGKGGVGKSSVTANLALALAAKDLKVGLIDADVYGFSIPKILGEDAEPGLIDEVMHPAFVRGIKCISIGYFVEESTPVVWRGPMLHKALEQFVNDVNWGELDFLLIDMPPGTGDVALSMAQLVSSTEILVVTTPQPAAQRVAQRSGMMAKEVGLNVVGVIENMSWFEGDDSKKYLVFGEGGGEQLANDLGVSLLGQIPLSITFRQGGDSGIPELLASPNSETSKIFGQLADSLVQLKRKRIYKSELKVV